MEQKKLLYIRTLEEVKDFINKEVLPRASQLNIGDKDQKNTFLFRVTLALEEALVNAVKHGNRENPALQVTIWIVLGKTFLRVEIEDEGNGFDPKAVPDPLAPENIELPGGRGVFLMKHYCQLLQFNKKGNKVTFEWHTESHTKEERSSLALCAL